MGTPDMHIFHVFLKESYETTTNMKDKILFKDIFENFRLWLEQKYGRAMTNKYGQAVIYTELRMLSECPTERSRHGLCLTYIIRKSMVSNANITASRSNISMPNILGPELIIRQSQTLQPDTPMIITRESPITDTIIAAASVVAPTTGTDEIVPRSDPTSLRSNIPATDIIETSPATAQPLSKLKPKVQLKILSKESSVPMRPPPVRAPFGNFASIPITYPNINGSKKYQV